MIHAPQTDWPAAQETDGFLGRGRFLSPEEARQILGEWNETGAPYPREQCIHQLIEEQAGRTPEATSVICGEDSLSYRGLNERAAALARWLAEKGVGPSSLMPLCLERSFEMIVAILGVLKAGGAYVPLDPDLPDSRLAFLMRDTGARVLLTQRRFKDRLAPLGDGRVEVVALDGNEDLLKPEGTAQRPAAGGVGPADPAYVIYTSGTTGQPKGVVLEHQALCNRITWMQRAYHLRPDDRVLQKTPYSFDVSGWEFFWPLITGASLVFARPEGHKDPHYLRELIESAKITVLHFVPSMLRAFLTMEGCGGCPSLRKVICSGEALPVPLKDLFFEKFPNVELHNLYGPTEAAIDVTAYRCCKEDRVVPIGKPIANTQIYIVDERMEPVPAGQTGELCIAGECLARGYLNRPELTAEKFVPNPFKPGTRMYRTGDLARWLPDGNIEYLGRSDHQIKIRGNRVELGEIESVILEQGGVSACAVVTTGGESENLKLVAYVVPEKSQAAGIHHQLRLAGQGELEGRGLQALPNGLEVAHLNASETEFLYREIFERQAYLRQGIQVDDGDCVLDVGANIGLFSLALFLSRERLRLHAFEPVPEIHQVLALNAGLFGSGWTAHAYGLSDAAGSEEFTYYPHLSMLSGAEADTAQEKSVVRSVLLREQAAGLSGVEAEQIDGLIGNRLESRRVRCELRTVSEVIRAEGLKVVHLLKVDVEKMEERVLRGILDSDWEKIRQLAIEVHDVDGRLERIVSLLAGKGYEVAAEQEELFGESRIFQVYARRREARREPAATDPARKERWIGQAEYGRRIREGLRAKLPEYMVPAAIVALEQLPLSPSGKIDRKALAQREFSPPGRKKRVLPRSEIERRVVRIWEELLGLPDVGTEEGFLELGGNSLLAVRTADRISKEFGCRYSVVSLFQHGRIREISDYLAALQQGGTQEGVPAGRSEHENRPAESADIEAVEAVLNRHPSIRRAVVVKRNDGRGAESLVAFAVANEDYFQERNAAKAAKERLEDWLPVWEQNYQPILGGRASSPEHLNSIGYVRSDSGAPIPEEELREGIESVIGQVMAHQPKRILEIGCGTGMLLFRFAGLVERYWATDLSRNAIEHIQASLRGNPQADRVTCFHCDASDLETVPVEEADMVVINSVVQYFPGIDYLTALVETLARRLPPKARIYIGDVRDLRLLRAFYAWALQRQCPGSTSKRRFRRLVADRLKLEKELVIHPAYFRHLRQRLPRLQRVRIQPRPGKFQNELIRFRYDVLLCLDEAPPEGALPEVRPASTPVESLEDWLQASGAGAGRAVYLTEIPNRRLWRELALLAWLDSPGEESPFSEILHAVDRQVEQGLDPAECLAWAAAQGWHAKLYWEHAQADGRFGLYLQPGDQPGGELPAQLENSFASVPPRQWSNHPSLMLDWAEHVPVLKQALRNELPGKLLPSTFLLVQELPLLANGEVDRDQLVGQKSRVAALAQLDRLETVRSECSTAEPRGCREPIAIVGMSGRFPQAADLEEFWENLRAGKDCIREVPAWRWSWQAIYGDPEQDPGRTRIKWGGFMDGVEEFDPLFFNLSPSEAEAIDPQHRLLMMYVWLAMEDAGYAARALSGSNTALFIGTGDTGYARLVSADKRRPDYGFLGVYPFSGPNRMSYFLNLHGPSEPINTACSSSLVAVHKAVEALQGRVCDLAFAGGVNTVPTPDGHISFSKVGLLSEDGRCKAFSSRANGFARGEGVGIITLKRLSDAEAAGDCIHAVILGSAENHGGRASSFSAPNPAGQAQVIEQAWRRAGIDPHSLGYIEAHGTGTKLGDPVEIEGLKKAFQRWPVSRGRNGKPACGLGSVKSNIGHLELAAGIVGLLKVVLQLKHRTVVKSLHCDEVNPLLELEGSPFYVVRENVPWTSLKDGQGREVPRRAGISSFGVGGVNAHLVVQEYVPRQGADPVSQSGGPPYLVVLSAKKEEALRESARRLLGHLRKRPELDLRSLAYTLQVGRDAMPERLGLLVDSAAELERGLKEFVEGAQASGFRFRGRVRPGAATEDQQAETLIQRKEYRALLEFWGDGGTVDWRLLYDKPIPARMPLPGYPFACERYWAGASPEGTEKKDSPPWLIEKIWREEEVPGAADEGPAGPTLVLVNEESIHLLQSLGADRRIVVGGHRVAPGSADFVVDFRDETAGERLAESLAAACGGVVRIVDLSDLYSQPQALDEPKLGKMAIYQALVGTFTPRRVLYFTQGLQSHGATGMSMAGAKFIGLIKMLGAEYGHIQARAIDIEPTGFADPVWFSAVVRAEFGSLAGAVEVCYRGKKRYVPSLAAKQLTGTERALSVRRDGVYVITGGTRGIGLAIARHLAAKGARRLVLLGRRPLLPKKDWERVVQGNELSDGERTKLTDLITLDRGLEELRVYSGLLTDRKALQTFFAQVRAECGNIRGIIHSAGAYPDLASSAFVSRELRDMQRVFEPKIDGLEMLDELFRDDDLDFFVTFTSLSGLIPRLARGLSDYVTANTFADQFTAYRFHQDRRTRYRTISWVDWNDTGYAVRMTPEDKARLERSLQEIGLTAFSSEEGCRLFDFAMAMPDRSWVLPCYLDLPAFQAAQPNLLCGPTPIPAVARPPMAGPTPAFLERLDRQLAQWETIHGPGAALTAETLAEFAAFEDLKGLDALRIGRIHQLLFPEEKQPPANGKGSGDHSLAAVIRRHLLNVLKVRELEDTAPFQDYGLDSISAMIFTNRLSRELKRDVPPEWVVGFPTVESLAARLERPPESDPSFEVA